MCPPSSPHPSKKIKFKPLYKFRNILIPGRARPNKKNCGPAGTFSPVDISSPLRSAIMKSPSGVLRAKMACRVARSWVQSGVVSSSWGEDWTRRGGAQRPETRRRSRAGAGTVACTAWDPSLHTAWRTKEAVRSLCASQQLRSGLKWLWCLHWSFRGYWKSIARFVLKWESCQKAFVKF